MIISVIKKRKKKSHFHAPNYRHKRGQTTAVFIVIKDVGLWVPFLFLTAAPLLEDTIFYAFTFSW